MRTATMNKPNLVNLKGKSGRIAFNAIKKAPVKSDERLRKETEECKKRILLARRKNENQ